MYFNISKEMDIDQCPFLADDKNVKKIKQAKEIIILKMAEPPTLKELAKEVDISLKNLKEGFKQVYGNTVFGFLFEHKMNVASNMLSSKNYNVNEVALTWATAQPATCKCIQKELVQHQKYFNSINFSMKNKLPEFSNHVTVFLYTIPSKIGLNKFLEVIKTADLLFILFDLSSIFYHR